MEKEICECKRDYKSPLSGICELCWDEKYPDEETLEEAKKYAELSYYGDEVDAFVRGAKWQAERMYSEEEVKQAFIDGSNNPIEEDDSYGTQFDKYMNEWFEQFKKK